MRCDTIGTRETHIDFSICEHEAGEAADPPLEGGAIGVDDVDAGVLAIGKIVFSTTGIDPAHIERP